jgi:hypothetical protein
MPRRSRAFAAPCRETARANPYCARPRYYRPRIPAIRAVEREIIETYAIDQRSECALVTNRKAAVEVAHEVRFLAALAFAERHAGVEIPDVPAVGDCHVAGVSATIDEDDPVFAIEAVVTRIIDEARDEEFLLRALRQISAERAIIVDPGEASAGMRTARPNDDGKPQVCGYLRQPCVRLRQPG